MTSQSKNFFIRIANPYQNTYLLKISSTVDHVIPISSFYFLLFFLLSLMSFVSRQNHPLQCGI